MNRAKKIRYIAAKVAREKKPYAKWWDSCSDDYRESQKFVIRILSLTCNSFGCEHNWSTFEIVKIILLIINLISIFLTFKNIFSY